MLQNWDKVDEIYNAMSDAIPEDASILDMMYATLSILYDILDYEGLSQDERLKLAKALGQRLENFARCMNAAEPN